jgi:hypothetical protein
VTGAPASGGWRLASPATALILGAAILVLMAAEPPLASLAHQSLLSSGGSVPLPYSVIFAAVGFVVAWRKPGNPLGWLILGAAGFFALSEDASFYAVADYRLHHGSLPLGWLALITQPGWAPGIASVGLIVLLFPDGRPPSTRWWWALWPYIALALLWIAGALAFTAAAILADRTRVDASGNLVVLAHPTGRAAWWGAAQNVFFFVLVGSWLASLAGQAMSYRRSSGERRQQLKWLLAGAAGGLAGLLLTLLGSSQGGWGVVIQILGAAGLFALPVCIGIGILRYRLFDIDRILSRTVAYAIITGLLLGVYAGLVLLATQVLGFASPVAVAGSTLAAAALFTPLRRRVQRIVDRRFNRARYDADAAVAAFATRLKGAVNLDSVRDDLVHTVGAALEPAQVSVWINGGRR